MKGLISVSCYRYQCTETPLCTVIETPLQSFTKYFRLTLAFMWNSYGKSLISVSQGFCASINIIFILTEILSTKISFHDV